MGEARPGPMRVALLLVALVTVIATVLHLGDLVGGWPPIDSVASTQTWLDGLEPPVLGFLVVRLVVLGSATYLFITTLLCSLAACTRAPVLAEVAGWVSPPALRRLVGRSLGLGLTASMVVGAGPTVAEPSPTTSTASAGPSIQGVEAPIDEPPVMVLLDDDGPSPPPTPSPSSTATQRLLDDADPARPTTPGVTTPASAPATAPARPATPPPAPPSPPPPSPPLDAGSPAPSGEQPAPPHGATPAAADAWTIAPGEHLWAVASETLGERRPGQPVTNQAIAAYLDVLIEVNRSRLADPDNPDLVYPGQVIVLPPVPSP